MADKALYILAGFDSNAESYLSSMQNALYEKGFSGKHTKNIPMHITLDSFPVEMEGELIERLQAISGETKEFDLSFSHVGIFAGARVLFVASDINKELLELKGIFGKTEGWVPHTTMIIDEPEVIMRAAPIILDGFSPFLGKVTTLHLYEFWPTRHILSVDLRKS